MKSVDTHSVCLRFHLHLNLNSRMAIQRQNCHWITIHQIWKSQSNSRMVIWRLFCHWIVIRPFRLELKRKWTNDNDKWQFSWLKAENKISTMQQISWWKEENSISVHPMSSMGSFNPWLKIALSVRQWMLLASCMRKLRVNKVGCVPPAAVAVCLGRGGDVCLSATDYLFLLKMVLHLDKVAPLVLNVRLALVRVHLYWRGSDICDIAVNS